MQRTGRSGGDERNVDLGFQRRTQLVFGFFGRFTQALERHSILSQVDGVALQKFIGELVDDPNVEVFAAEMCVTACSLDVEYAALDLENRDVEGSAAEIVHRDFFCNLLVQAIRERGRRRLVQDPFDVEAGDPPGVLRGLPLCVVEVSGNRDDGFGDRLAEITLGDRFHALEHHARDLGRRVLLALDLDPRVAVVVFDHSIRHTRALLLHFGSGKFLSHQALDCVHRVLGIGRRLALGYLPDQPLAPGREGDDRGRGAGTLGIGNDAHIGLARSAGALEHRNARVRRAKIDPDDLPHVLVCQRNATAAAAKALEFSAARLDRCQTVPLGALATTTIAGRTRRSPAR
jgi:hypothetical protein